MDSGIYLLQSDNVLVRMNETPYEAEALLQLLLERHPDLLAGDQIDPAVPRRWLLIEREAGIPGSHDGSDWWSVDHLFLDQDAIPTFVEVKRASDTRSRREVVAQMLDYAANATEHWPVDKMREMLALRCAHIGIEPAEEIEQLVGMEYDEEAFWQRAHRNLREGRIRMLFVADKIPPPLQRIVEFLNRQMSPAEVLAVEVKQFTSDSDTSLRTLVPRVIGQTEQARVSKATSRPSLSRTAIDRESFLAGAPPEVADLVATLLVTAESLGYQAGNFVSADEGASTRITLPNALGTPVTLTYRRLWVSLGRHHPALKAPDTNQALRQAILQLSPSTRSAQRRGQTEVGILLDSINPERLSFARDLFETLKRGLNG